MIREIAGHRYHLSKAPARRGMQLLRAWCDVDAEIQEAFAAELDTQADRAWSGVHPLTATDEDRQRAEQAEGVRLSASMARMRAAENRARAAFLLTDERIDSLVLPTLKLALVEGAGGSTAIMELVDCWESHFSGRIGALFEVLEAIRDHNFADFFGASPLSGGEAATAEPEPTQTTTPGSGRPSVRASVRSQK